MSGSGSPTATFSTQATFSEPAAYDPIVNGSPPDDREGTGGILPSVNLEMPFSAPFGTIPRVRTQSRQEGLAGFVLGPSRRNGAIRDTFTRFAFVSVCSVCSVNLC